jgi:hypothetical protein
MTGRRIARRRQRRNQISGDTVASFQGQVYRKRGPISCGA